MARATRRRGVVYLDAGWHSIVGLMARRLAGHDVWYLRVRSARSERTIHRLGARRIDISTAPLVDIGPRSTEGPMDRALARLADPRIARLCAFVAQHHEGVPEAAGILRTALVRAVGARNLDAFYAEAWVRTAGYTRPTFVVTSAWDRLLLADTDRRVVGRVDTAIAGCMALLGRAYRLVAPRRSSQRTTASMTSTHIPTSGGLRAWRPDAAAQGPVLFVLNRGTSYGGLYSYDHVLSDDPASPLGPTRLVAMAATGGPANVEGITRGYPDPGTLGTRLPARLGLFVRCLTRSGSRTPVAAAWLLSGISVRAAHEARALAATLPHVQVALLAYDLQVPADLVLALEMAGIRTVALNERPLSVVLGSQPLAVGTLLTASSLFSRAAERSVSVSVRRTRAVGMWRTDLLRRYARQPSDVVAEWRARGGRVMVALPYHVDDGPGGNPLATSTPSVRHFLVSVLDLAARYPSTLVVVRGKNASWLTAPAFADLAARAKATTNVHVSTDYATLDESYRLVAGADLVLAKYTSLVEESLAVGIPCVVHDFTPNAAGIAQAVVPYLPARIWAVDEDELRQRVDEVLADGGTGFRAWWEPHRAHVFEGLADGAVADRARREILGLLDDD